MEKTKGLLTWREEHPSTRKVREGGKTFCLLYMWGGGGGGDRGAGARENRGREGYGRRERKGWEVGVLRGREAGEQYKTMNFFTY